MQNILANLPPVPSNSNIFSHRTCARNLFSIGSCWVPACLRVHVFSGRRAFIDATCPLFVAQSASRVLSRVLWLGVFAPKVSHGSRSGDVAWQQPPMLCSHADQTNASVPIRKSQAHFWLENGSELNPISEILGDDPQMHWKGPEPVPPYPQ